ncbi:MAG: hypothetical protein JWO88_3945, partial [Frankiales bacterium]|nr:hypothetical protein [Frankiales bacterium]
MNAARSTAAPARRDWGRRARLIATSALAGSVALALASHAYAIPGDGVVVGGQA